MEKGESESVNGFREQRTFDYWYIVYTIRVLGLLYIPRAM